MFQVRLFHGFITVLDIPDADCRPNPSIHESTARPTRKRQAKERFRVFAFCEALILIVYPSPSPEKKSKRRALVEGDVNERRGVVRGRRRRLVLDDDDDDDDEDEVVIVPKAKRKRRDANLSVLAPYVEELRDEKASQEARSKLIDSKLDPPHKRDMDKIRGLRAQTAAALSTEDVLEHESLNKSSVPR